MRSTRRGRLTGGVPEDDLEDERLREYTGLFIFSESLDENELGEVVNVVKGEIEKRKGTVDATEMMGRRAFARRMSRKDAGHYVRLAFRIDYDQIPELHHRYKLNEQVFRVQITRKIEREANPEPADDAAEKATTS